MAQETDEDEAILSSYEIVQSALPEPFKAGTLGLLQQDRLGKFQISARRVELHGVVMSIFQSPSTESPIWVKSEIADVETYQGSDVSFGIRVEFISPMPISCLKQVAFVTLSCVEEEYLPWLRTLQACLELPCLLHRVIEESQLDILKTVGSGAFGIVYQAHLRSSKGSSVVAVKQLGDCLDDISRVTEFLNEASILARLKHPCLLEFYGISIVNAQSSSIVSARTYGLVTEYCVGGNLKQRLFTLSEEGRVIGPGKRPFTRVDAVRVGREVACGLEYLHQHRICHRDLKPDNILFHVDDHVKIVDFGSSCEVMDRAMTGNIGSLLWTAPEVFTENGLCRFSNYSTKVDIYSFGILLWQMWTRQEPYKDVRHFWEIRAGAYFDIHPTNLHNPMYHHYCLRCLPCRRPQWIAASPPGPVVAAPCRDAHALVLVRRAAGASVCHAGAQLPALSLH
jgi:hypothetical protein